MLTYDGGSNNDPRKNPVKAILTALAATAALVSVPAQARDFGLTGSVGTTGLSLHLSTAVTSSVNARVGFNFLHYSHDIDTNNVNYDTKLKLQGLEALADYFPMGNPFRISAGIVYNGNKFEARGVPRSNGTYTLNGRTYTAASVGALEGTIDFRNFAPYLGIGWGNAASAQKGWGFSADLGVMFQGSPRTSLTNTGCTAPAAICAQIASDVAAENRNLNDEVKDFRYFPVVRVGAIYRF